MSEPKRRGPRGYRGTMDYWAYVKGFCFEPCETRDKAELAAWFDGVATALGGMRDVD